ncbi:HNH endonuclease family protein [Staphylococcus massiliensis]|uniref:GmrSD restriction endonuclease domain-containing protein n=1 Tax=Staphylococcus massiliensis TaxID=555791 RepID=UPI001EDEED8E|nr:DUF1524 domain-containing protein [Staphylococcus massiliensis]MCG3402122.1 HNH endonuclease family protein [Staphylococcus massiliensis]
MPQSADKRKNWKKELSKQTNNDDRVKILVDENVHRIGNLTLTGYNFEMSAKAFEDKRDYRDPKTNEETGLKTRLYLNDSIVSEDESIDDKNTWTIEDIDRRSKLLIKEVVDTYKWDI